MPPPRLLCPAPREIPLPQALRMPGSLRAGQAPQREVAEALRLQQPQQPLGHRQALAGRRRGQRVLEPQGLAAPQVALGGGREAGGAAAEEAVPRRDRRFL